MKKERYNDYDPFAWLYNKHWGHMFTPIAMAAIEKLVMPNMSQGNEILDLCCGTGQLAQKLKERGYRVSGIDGSEKMLTYARENAPGVIFKTADARSFVSDTSYDAVVCVFDSLNHIMSIEDLGDVFKSVYYALKDNGIFMFDMNLEAGYTTRWNGIFGIVEDDHVCVIRNSYDTENRIGLFDATLFRLEQYWQRADFTLTQRCYPVPEIQQKLIEAGFEKIIAYNFSPQQELTGLTPEAHRGFFRCIK
jgi:SAM-dependent methyltransferase